MLAEITNELSKIGTVQVIKNDFVFSLLMTKDKQNLSDGMVSLKVLDVVTNYLGNEKPIVEVMKNEEDFLILILKPKT